MSVLINFKICDNSKACIGISTCPTGAFQWDEENKTIKVDKEKCINCGKCACCDVGAIHFARNNEEEKKIKEEIENDPRNANDLLVDRYGASPILDAYLITEDRLETAIQTKKGVAIELFKEDTIECLLKSIPIKELLQCLDGKWNFRKIEVKTDKLLKKYEIKKLPALIFLSNDNVIGKIEGYYTTDEKDEVISKIKEFNNIDM